MNKLASIAALVALLGHASMAQADILSVTGATVVRTLVTSDTTHGGCMAELSVPMGTGCTGNWVTFSCAGSFTDKDRAYRMLDQAQMALALGKRVNVFADNTRKHNGYCFAAGIQVY